MADPDFWRKLADEFRALDGPYGRLLSAVWTEDVGSSTQARWLLTGGGQSTKLKFEALARRGAIAMGANADLLSTWLDALKEHFPTDFKAEGFVVTSGTPLDGVNGLIARVCAVSADLCSKLESRALEAAFRPELVAETKTATPRVEAPVDTAKEESLASQLRRLREESRLTIEALTEAVGIDSRSVERHLSGKTIPRIGHIGAYERVFTEALQRKVVISKVPVKCR